MTCIPQGGRKAIYSPREKTSRLGQFLRVKPAESSAAPSLAPDLPADIPASRAWRRNFRQPNRRAGPGAGMNRRGSWRRRNARRNTQAHTAAAELTGGAGPGAETFGEQTGMPGWPPKTLSVWCSAYWSGEPNLAPVDPAVNPAAPVLSPKCKKCLKWNFLRRTKLSSELCSRTPIGMKPILLERGRRVDPK